MGKTGGGKGTNQYQIKGHSVSQIMHRRGRYQERPEQAVELQPLADFYATPLEDLALVQPSEADLSRFAPRGTERACFRYVQRRADFAFSSAYLEGNTFTLPEVYTLLEGTTPTGKRSTDVDQILDLTEASEHLVERVQSSEFAMTLDEADPLNGVISRNEAITPGVRRIHSSVNSDGRGASVNVMGQSFEGLNKAQLEHTESVLAERTSTIDHPLLRGATFAAMMSYMQPYMDGNKRTARYMMDGELMTNGFDAVAIPAARRDEYQNALAEMFRTADTGPYVMFLLDVAHRGDPVG